MVHPEVAPRAEIETQQKESETVQPDTEVIKAIDNWLKRIDKIECEKKSIGKSATIAEHEETEPKIYQNLLCSFSSKRRIEQEETDNEEKDENKFILLENATAEEQSDYESAIKELSKEEPLVSNFTKKTVM